MFPFHISISISLKYPSVIVVLGNCLSSRNNKSMVTGFYVVDLAARGKHEVAQRYLAGIHRANALEMDGEPWSFPEYVHGRNFVAGGTRYQGWSAAAAVIGHHALEGADLLRGDDHD